MVYSRMLPYVNFAIASTALIFQVTVLYPWHEKLEQDFIQLKHEQEEELKRYHQRKVERFDKLESTLQRVEAAILNYAQAHENKKI